MAIRHRQSWDEESGGSRHLRVALSFTLDPDDRVRVRMVVSGELDVATVGPVQAAARAVAEVTLYSRAQPVAVELDWEGVSFLDCTGVRLLDDLHTRAIDQGWSLRWVPPSARGPAHLLRLAADRGWLPRSLVPQLPAQSRPIPGRQLASVGCGRGEDI